MPDCITGRFDQYWSANGGLAVFGLPLTPASKQRTGEGSTTYLVQVFERARFELHPHDPKPYDVQLSRLGVDTLAAQGRDWQAFPKGDPAAPNYFAETGQAIAPQFWGFWSSNGLEFDGDKKAKSFQESLALFGMPISPPQMEQSSDGQMYLTQWYERGASSTTPRTRRPTMCCLACWAPICCGRRSSRPRRTLACRASRRSRAHACRTHRRPPRAPRPG